jgi:hypothetical protein
MKPYNWPAAFDEARLAKVAYVLVEARNSAAEAAQPELGDAAWGTGCRAYERGCHAIRSLAERCEWLTVLQGESGGLEFVFAMDDVPLRFFRGDADRPGSRHSRRTSVEDEARQELLGFMEDGGEAFRLCVTTGEGGRVASVALLAVLDGEVRSTRPISWALASSASADDGEAPIVTHKSEKRGGTAAGSGTGS